MKKLLYTLCIVLITNLSASDTNDQKATLEQACQAGSALACYEMKLIYGEESVKTLKKESFKNPAKKEILSLVITWDLCMTMEMVKFSKMTILP